MNLRKIVVIGAGTMGSGIAQWFTQQLCTVELIDTSEAQLQKALADIHSSWDKLAEKKKLSNPEELKKLPPGSYAIESVEQVPSLTDEGEQGIASALQELDAGKGISLSDVVNEIRRSSRP